MIVVIKRFIYFCMPVSYQPAFHSAIVLDNSLLIFHVAINHHSQESKGSEENVLGIEIEI